MKEIKNFMVREWIPTRQKDSHKGDFGRVLFIGGNEQMGGAIILSASAAVYSGAGLVTVATHPSNKPALHSRLPEAMFVDSSDLKAVEEKLSSMDTIVIGPGLGRKAHELDLLSLVRENMSAHQFLVIDGDALSLFAENDLPETKAKVILTPHLGEWQKLSGLSPKNENETANREIQKKLNAIVVLKKARTEIYMKNQVWRNSAGNPGMATGGMGDTLAGMIGGFLHQFDDKDKALITAVYLHSRIADLMNNEQYVIIPSQLIQRIPKTMKGYENKPLPYV
ncbi:NAD(P)H-hydrate dehydratase [Lacticigenium naphthae]|uniref:NAD(P)H-hydrate dehydratase n=1 Tax=Lacticigenium naphthae TaxID=515351 RepID=UPI0004280420|nr:NAD(P)H-hydrate dehydratase [Lacticigenium naphthae]